MIHTSLLVLLLALPDPRLALLLERADINPPGGATRAQVGMMLLRRDLDQLPTKLHRPVLEAGLRLVASGPNPDPDGPALEGFALRRLGRSDEAWARLTAALRVQGSSLDWAARIALAELAAARHRFEVPRRLLVPRKDGDSQTITIDLCKVAEALADAGGVDPALELVNAWSEIWHERTWCYGPGDRLRLERALLLERKGPSRALMFALADGKHVAMQKLGGVIRTLLHTDPTVAADARTALSGAAFGYTDLFPDLLLAYTLVHPDGPELLRAESAWQELQRPVPPDYLTELDRMCRHLEKAGKTAEAHGLLHTIAIIEDQHTFGLDEDRAHPAPAGHLTLRFGRGRCELDARTGALVGPPPTSPELATAARCVARALASSPADMLARLHLLRIHVVRDWTAAHLVEDVVSESLRVTHRAGQSEDAWTQELRALLRNRATS